VHPPIDPIAFVLTLMTAQPPHAAAAHAAGVDRIGVDLEVRGKSERQVSRPSWIAGHSLDDLREVARVVPPDKLFARIHPFTLGGREELEAVLAAGARFVMLPMFTTASEALDFVRAIGGRATPVLLLETEGAALDLDALLRSELDFEIHVGLNDLGISRGHASPFEMLVDPLLETIAGRVRASGRPFAIGRLARPGDAGLPISADLICALTVSLGARGSFLSQYFSRGIDPADSTAMREAVQALRLRLEYWVRAAPHERSVAMSRLAQSVRALPRPP
jgi:hypothetical protein